MTTKRPRMEYTDEDVLKLVTYLATDQSGYSPSGNKIYQRLEENPEKWPWGQRHSWQSWRERYKKDPDWFNAKIALIQRQKAAAAQKQVQKNVAAHKKRKQDLDDASPDTRSSKRPRHNVQSDLTSLENDGVESIYPSLPTPESTDAQQAPGQYPLSPPATTYAPSHRPSSWPSQQGPSHRQADLKHPASSSQRTAVHSSPGIEVLEGDDSEPEKTRHSSVESDETDELRMDPGSSPPEEIDEQSDVEEGTPLVKARNPGQEQIPSDGETAANFLPQTAMPRQEHDEPSPRPYDDDDDDSAVEDAPDRPVAPAAPPVKQEIEAAQPESTPPAIPLPSGPPLLQRWNSKLRQSLNLPSTEFFATPPPPTSQGGKPKKSMWTHMPSTFVAGLRTQLSRGKPSLGGQPRQNPPPANEKGPTASAPNKPLHRPMARKYAAPSHKRTLQDALQEGSVNQEVEEEESDDDAGEEDAGDVDEYVPQTVDAARSFRTSASVALGPPSRRQEHPVRIVPPESSPVPGVVSGAYAPPIINPALYRYVTHSDVSEDGEGGDQQIQQVTPGQEAADAAEYDLFDPFNQTPAAHGPPKSTRKHIFNTSPREPAHSSSQWGLPASDVPVVANETRRGSSEGRRESRVWDGSPMAGGGVEDDGANTEQYHSYVTEDAYEYGDTPRQPVAGPSRHPHALRFNESAQQYEEEEEEHEKGPDGDTDYQTNFSSPNRAETNRTSASTTPHRLVRSSRSSKSGQRASSRDRDRKRRASRRRSFHGMGLRAGYPAYDLSRGEGGAREEIIIVPSSRAPENLLAGRIPPPSSDRSVHDDIRTSRGVRISMDDGFLKPLLPSFSSRPSLGNRSTVDLQRFSDVDIGRLHRAGRQSLPNLRERFLQSSVANETSKDDGDRILEAGLAVYAQRYSLDHGMSEAVSERAVLLAGGLEEGDQMLSRMKIAALKAAEEVLEVSGRDIDDELSVVEDDEDGAERMDTSPLPRAMLPSDILGEFRAPTMQSSPPTAPLAPHGSPTYATSRHPSRNTTTGQRPVITTRTSFPPHLVERPSELQIVDDDPSGRTDGEPSFAVVEPWTAEEDAAILDGEDTYFLAEIENRRGRGSVITRMLQLQ